MARANKYGRQVFLSREDIRLLKDLVVERQEALADDIRFAEEYRDDLKEREVGGDAIQAYEEDLIKFAAEGKRLEKLDKKLFYYVTPEEMAARNG